MSVNPIDVDEALDPLPAQLGHNGGQNQAPETFLAVLGAAWQSWSHFNPIFMYFGEQQSCSRSQELGGL